MKRRVTLITALLAQVLKPRSARKSTRHRLHFEELDKRLPMAVDLEVAPESPVAQYAAALSLSEDVSVARVSIGPHIQTTSISELLTRYYESEAINGVLYSVGVTDGNASYISTNLATNVSELVVLPALLPGSNKGIVFDVAQLNGGVVFAGQSLASAGGSSAPVTWDVLKNPTAVLQPEGAVNEFGSARAITPNGFIGGRTLSHGAFIATNEGSYQIPQPGTGFGAVNSISESGRFAVGGAVGINVAWKAIGNPEEGNYQLLVFAWQLPAGAQGIETMSIVVDHPVYDGVAAGRFVDSDGEYHDAFWSLKDGSLIKDFGVGSIIFDLKMINGKFLVAYKDATGSHVMVEGGEVYDLDTLLGTDGAEFVSGGLFQTADAIGFTYLVGTELRASTSELVTGAPAYDLAWDFDNDGTVDLTEEDKTFPHTVDHVFTEPGETTVKVALTDQDGNVTTVEEMVVVIRLYCGDCSPDG